MSMAPIDLTVTRNARATLSELYRCQQDGRKIHLRAVAERCGINHKTAYRHFRSLRDKGLIEAERPFIGTAYKIRLTAKGKHYLGW